MPFLRKYPAFIFVVTTFKAPPRSGPPGFPSPKLPRVIMVPGTSQLATEIPCQSPPCPCVAPKYKVLVWVPASNSAFSVLSSCQVMCILPGRRTIAAAPYALHCPPEDSSFAGSHAWAALRPSALSGTDSASPLGGTVMRERQSSVTSETQYPVRSTGAAARGVGGGPGGGPKPGGGPCAETIGAGALNISPTHHDVRFPLLRILMNIAPETDEKYSDRLYPAIPSSINSEGHSSAGS